MSETNTNTTRTITIDGREAEVFPDETVLSVARRLGIDIPALCFHPAITAYGACRVCVVEVKKGKRSRMVTSCIYIPGAGDVVETANERVRKLRRMILELLLARCPDVEALGDLARQYGIDSPPRFKATGGEAERCIVCGLCVRVCAEVIGQHAIGYVNRGGKRVIGAPFGAQAENCIGCGACVYVCPTKALHSEDIRGKRVLAGINTSLAMKKCAGCGSEFATKKQLDNIKHRLPAPHDRITLCPSCRRAAFRAAAEQAFV